MFICDDCNKTFENPVIYVNKINNRSFIVCPHCGSVAFSNAVKCAMCGKDIPENNVFCEDCIDKAIDGVIAENYVREDIGSIHVSIPRFLAFVYSSDEIEDLLRKDFELLPGDMKKSYIRSFINGEKEQFSDYLSNKKGDK